MISGVSHRRGILRLVLAASTALICAPAWSQDAFTGPTVVMRRPLPFNQNVVSTPDDCAVTGACPSPTPGTPTPVTPTPTTPSPTPSVPTPTPTPACEDDGSGMNCPQDYDQFDWVPTEWTGSAVCGQQSTLTRGLSCNWTHYGYEGETIVTPVDASYCSNYASGDAPETTYSGTQANCGYHYVDEGLGPWMVEPGGSGTATCSDQALRPRLSSCRDAQNVQVDDALCRANVTPGGTPQSPGGDDYYGEDENGDGYPDGNHSSCKGVWIEKPYDIGCSTSAHMFRVDYACRRDDGQVFDADTPESAACDIGKPLARTEQRGTCHIGYDMSMYTYDPAGNSNGDNACLSSAPGDQVVLVPNANAYQGEAACVSAGVSCCQSRYNHSRGRYEVVGTMGSPVNVRSRMYNFNGNYNAYNDETYGQIVDNGNGTTTSYPVMVVATAGASGPVWKPDY